MKKNKLIYGLLSVALLLGPVACKDQLDVGNPNAPTVAANVNSEAGLVSYAQGVTYVNGFRNGNDWLGNSYFSLPWGYSELMADNVGASASNNQVTTMGIPDYIILDNGTKISNTSPQVAIIRTYNSRAASGAGNNALYYQWLTMYALNTGANTLVELADKIPYSGDVESKAATVKAWAYWWKGYAYAAIGSMYYSGVINDEAGVVSHDYVTHDAVIERSNFYYNLAATTLQGIASESDYADILGKLIPDFNQVGHGGVPSRAAWQRNINTMLARNIVVNKLSPFVNGNPNATISKSSTTAMTAADWAAVKTLTANGIQKGDPIFTARSTSTNSIFGATGGNVAALTASKPSSSTFKISERFLHNFDTVNDNRFKNNFVVSDGYKGDYIYTTTHTVVDGGKGLGGYVYASQSVGNYEVVIAGSYEENALMLAEANIRSGSIDAGATLINDVRSYLGAGSAVTPVASGLSLAQALTELVKERRVALVFRGLSFYDSRRWGWTYDIANGGGSYNNFVKYGGANNTKVIINYNFMDYWDVPADESALNKAAEGSAPLQNPNY